MVFLKASLTVCYLNVLGRAKPKLDIYPSLSQTIKVGESALFQCRVMGGDPPPTISWAR